MSLASFAFLGFLAVVFALRWALPKRFSWIALLAASVLFAACFDVRLTAVLAGVTGVSYACALMMNQAKTERARRLCLAGGIILCLAALIVFKYLGFFMQTISAALRALSLPASPVILRLALPAGISFYTFQALSYMIDVYRRKIEPERHFGYYALYVSFFPKLTAGPIERAGSLLPQLRENRPFDEALAISGARQMLWGLFKKVTLADVLTRGVDAVYGAPGEYGALPLIAATLAFTVQIYCDFSGYSDIAIGCAKTLGIRLNKNFDSPYFSRSIKEFWSRWHISLSSWFRDYVYIPLGGNRRGRARRALNVMITFILSGLWHGASATFLAWGAYHGALNVLSDALNRKRKKRGVIMIPITLIAVAAGWVLFRADTLSDAALIAKRIFTPSLYALSMQTVKDTLKIFCSSDAALIALAFSFTLLTIFDVFSLKTDVFGAFGRLPRIVRFAVYLLLALLVLICPGRTEGANFIYAQF